MTEEMKLNLFIILLFLLSLSMSVVLTVPSFKNAVKNYFQTQDRVILGKVMGKTASIDKNLVFLKIRQKDNILIEIYKEDASTETLEFWQKIDLGPKREGQFTFNGEATNLVYSNIDSDPDMELLVPVFDLDMTARLYTIKYNNEIKQFEIIEK